MAKRTIRVEIDCEDVGCGECPHWEIPWLNYRCKLFESELVLTDSSPRQVLRCEACKQAEAKP